MIDRDAARGQTSTSELRAEFGNIDIYLFDQLLRGRIRDGMRVLDAGCGEGRNLVWLLRAGFDVRGVDESAAAVRAARAKAAALAPALEPERFSVGPVERLAFDAGAFDLVISSAVLHFARDEEHWWSMVREMWRVLAPGGILFTRLASTIGHEERVRSLGGRRYVLPDGTERFLVDEDHLMDTTARLGGTLLDPLKTTVVQGTRSMTTWVMTKP
jgi:tellurite methyltransferase